MKFRDIFALKHILFAVFIAVVMIPFVIWQSNNTVKINVNERQVLVRSARYQLLIDYEIIESLELVPLAEPGEKLNEESFDDDIVRFGEWKNDVWGAYTICADLDVETCIVAHLDDGRIFVFNRKDNEETKMIYEQLLTRIPN